MSSIVGSAILFADLVGSSDFAGVLSLLDYAGLIEAFERVCLKQCDYFFHHFQRDRIVPEDFRYDFVGDQLVVFLHTGKSANDVYQLACLAQALKCAWLGVPFNQERIISGRPAVEMGIGIHFGPIVRAPAAAFLADQHPSYRGYAINLAKRMESASREGRHFRILVSDTAHKALALRTRHILFGPRVLPKLKGFNFGIGAREIYDSFIDISNRCEPTLLRDFLRAAPPALATTTYDHWIFSCYQVITGEACQCVTDDGIAECHRMLRTDPENAVALYYLTQGLIERERFAEASVCAGRLVEAWPTFADGWLYAGRLHKMLGNAAEAQRCLAMASLLGVSATDEGRGS